MKKIAFICCLLISAIDCFALGDKPYNQGYDPLRDPAVDYEQAKLDAAKTGKLVLLEFGGDWCIWCHRLDKFIASDAELKAGFDDVFVVLKVNVSDEKSKLDFSKQFPAIKGYPHFIVANARGEVLGSQDTGKLESGESYSKTKVKDFITLWRAKK